jgi:glycosyltransferase involved in cell wall biosynthesis
MIKVSVIIPAYNRAKTLPQALKSVLNQSFQDFEIIVIDDASSDGTGTLIQACPDSRIQYVLHNTNKGAAAARNTGIRIAKGEWLAFLDSDDEWSLEKLERQLIFIKQQASDVFLSCTGYTLNLLDEGRQISRTLSHHTNINESIFSGCDISPGSTLLVKKNVFDQVGYFDETLKRLEDWDWLIRYRSFGRIALLQEPLAIINNKRGREGLALEQSISIFIAKHKGSFKNVSYFKKREILANIWLQAAGTYRRERNYYKTLLTLAKAHRWDPTILLKFLFRVNPLENAKRS